MSDDLKDDSILNLQTGDTKEAPITFERGVINEGMIRRAVITEMKERYPNNKKVIPDAKDVDLTKIDHLCLSFENIYRVDNLLGFEQLTKLQLDNNIIEKIEHLDHLVNLRWLDLSFNNIKKIEGLDNLTQLEDLSLFDNQISTIENLSTLTNLNVLSLGNNNIEVGELLNIFKELRPFKNLRLLNLKGNSVTQQDDYKVRVLAWLGNQLKYLDYELIEKSAVNKARESIPQEDMDIIQKWESNIQKNEEEQKHQEIEAKEQKRLDDASLGVLGSLVDAVIHADKEQAKINKLAGYDEICKKFRDSYQEKTDKFIQAALTMYDLQLEEYAAFQEGLNVYEETEERCRSSIRRLASKKKRVFRAYDAQWAGYADKRANQQLTEEDRTALHAPLGALKKDVTQLMEDLMDIEMLLVDQNASMITTFKDAYERLSNALSQKNGEFFQDLSGIENEYKADLKALVTQLNQKVQKDEDVPDDPVVADFIRDKDKALETVDSSFNNHSTTLAEKSETVSVGIKRNSKALIEKVETDEKLRNRHRVTEIFALCERYNELIDAKLKENAEEFDDNIGWDQDYGN